MENGAIAQLGERFNGIEEVVGSIPSGSTNQINHLAKVIVSATWHGVNPGVNMTHFHTLWVFRQRQFKRSQRAIGAVGRRSPPATAPNAAHERLC